ncbi:MAG: hypothetical protein AAF696_04140 [Bacteroidota bacterium]
MIILLASSACTETAGIPKQSNKLRLEKIYYYKYPKDSDLHPFKYKLTYYFEHGEPHKWVELDSLKHVITEYIYQYDDKWNHIGAKYREEGELNYSLEKVRIEGDSIQITEWVDSLGNVFYTMTDFLNEEGKTKRAEFKGDKVHGYDSTFYTKEGFPKRIFFTNTKGKVFNDRQFEYNSINEWGDWISRKKIMNDTIREIHIREVYYDDTFTTHDHIFYPNILSTENWSENVFSFTENEGTIFQSRTKDWENQRAFIATKTQGLFTESIPLAIDSIYNGAISPSGGKIIYSSKSKGKEQIWLIEKNDTEWSEPINISKSNNLKGGYFHWWSEEELFFYIPHENGNIVQAKLQHNQLSITDSLSQLNTAEGTEFSPYVDKNKSFLIFTRYLEGDSLQQGFFITYNQNTLEEPEWSAPKKLPSLAYGWNAYLIDDNKRFLYTDGEDIKSVAAATLKLQ